MGAPSTLKCGKHGKRRPWACVCTHVQNGAIPIERVRPEDAEDGKGVGYVACVACVRVPFNPDNFNAVCVECCEARAWLPVRVRA